MQWATNVHAEVRAHARTRRWISIHTEITHAYLYLYLYVHTYVSMYQYNGAINGVAALSAAATDARVRAPNRSGTAGAIATIACSGHATAGAHCAGASTAHRLALRPHCRRQWRLQPTCMRNSNSLVCPKPRSHPQSPILNMNSPICDCARARARVCVCVCVYEYACVCVIIYIYIDIYRYIYLSI